MGDETLEAWRAGGAANDGATWRQDVVVRGRGNDPRRGAACKNPAAAPNSGAAQTGCPKRSATSKNLAASTQWGRTKRPNAAASANRKWLKQRTKTNKQRP